MGLCNKLQTQKKCWVHPSIWTLKFVINFKRKKIKNHSVGLSSWFIQLALQETGMPPDGQSSRSGDPRRPSGSSEVGPKLSRAGTFTSRVREAGCSVAARDNTHLRGNFARGFVTHLHADAAIIAHMPNSVSKLQWKVWQFFEDPSSSRAVRHLLPLSW